MAQFTVNTHRFDPYKNFKFRVKWDGRYVAGVSKVGSLKRSTEVVEHREGGDPSTSRKSPGRTFSEAVAVNREPELISADGEARPQIAAIGQRIYVSWTQALPQPFAGHIRLAVSDDGGKSFGEPVTVNDDSRPITHRFNAMLADAQGVTLAWIDKRDGACGNSCPTA